MNTSIKTRAAALCASILVSFATVYLAAEYALPAAPALLLAAVSR